MPILGIDYGKCNNCQNCFYACLRCFRWDKEQKRIIFEDPNNLCDSCGRCVAMCKEDALIYENLGELLTFKEVQDPSTLISYEIIHKFMSAKRSIRRFKKKKVPRELLQKVLDSMKYAPTAANIRTLKCTILSDDDKIKKFSEVVMDAIIKSNNPMYSEFFKKAKKRGVDTIFYNAPHIMIIHSNNPADAMNSTIALTYGMLSAQALGLGTCWIGLAQTVVSMNKELREKIIGIDGTVWGIIIIGYPSQIYYRIPPRPDLKIQGLNELD
ncbi:MAG: nitroreductase family protein [Promethearchaeota archaeon]